MMEQSKHTGTNKPFGFLANRKIDREALQRKKPVRRERSRQKGSEGAGSGGV